MKQGESNCDSEESECPGDGKCHGPMRWCTRCGEVDLVCDFPECDSHPRIGVIQKIVESSRREVQRLESELRLARKELDEAEEKLYHYLRGPYRMTKESRLDVIRTVMDS